MALSKDQLVKLLALRLLDDADPSERVARWVKHKVHCDFIYACVQRMLMADFGTAPANICARNIANAKPGAHGDIWGGYRLPNELLHGWVGGDTELMLILNGHRLHLATPADINEIGEKKIAEQSFAGPAPSMN